MQVDQDRCCHASESNQKDRCSDLIKTQARRFHRNDFALRGKSPERDQSTREHSKRQGKRSHIGNEQTQYFNKNPKIELARDDQLGHIAQRVTHEQDKYKKPHRQASRNEYFF